MARTHPPGGGVMDEREGVKVEKEIVHDVFTGIGEGRNFRTS